MYKAGIWLALILAVGVASLNLFEMPLAAMPIYSASPPATDPVVRVQTTDTNAQIYIFRGLANVFSLGMNELSNKLSQRGYSPKVMNWKFWSTAASEIAANYQGGRRSPIILIGHSLGADVVFEIAKNLREKHISVDYMATFDVTKPHALPPNVLRFVNFYQDNGFGRRVSSPHGYRGEMDNVDLTGHPNLNHGNIDEATKLHEIVISKIQEVTARRQ